MGRRPRLAAQAAAASMRTPIPNISDNEDDEMQDALPDETPAAQADDEDVDAEEVNDDDDDEQNDAEDDATPSRDSKPTSRSATPRRRGRPPNPFSLKRRLGRPPKHRPVGSEDDGNDGTSDVGTPRRRGGFRGGRGGRWGKPKGGPSRSSHQPVDVDGNVLEIVNDELELPEDPEGEKKVDKNGYLLGGREYRVRTFTIFGRDDRLYMLSTEPARCIGFRDSYLFFQKHRNLYKIIIDDDEKRDLIDRDLIPHSYKGRAIGVVTARSVFREFGARIIIGGKKVSDDYEETAAKERGDVEGEIAVPEDRLPPPGEPYNRNQYVAWHGASAVYHTNTPSVPLQNGKVPDGKRRKIVVTSDNWMLEHAREASRFNSTLATARRENFQGLYDIHTNVMQWPSTMQPTHARWDLLDDDNSLEERGKHSTGFALPPLDPIYSRNFRIHDLCLESAPDSSLGEPGSHGSDNGVSSIASHVLEELPAECLQALQAAITRETKWRHHWRTERIDGHRAQFAPSVEWYPK